MEEKDLRRGRPAWADPSPGELQMGKGLEDWKRKAVPRSKSHEKRKRGSLDQREGASRASSSRPRRRDRYQNASDSEGSRPPDGEKREVLAGLGRTSGLTSAGAWSARLEIANLLEVGCSPDHVVSMIRKGAEEQHPLGANGELKLVWVNEKGEVCKSLKRKADGPPAASLAEESKSAASSVEDPDEVADALSHGAGLASLQGGTGPLPPWVESQAARKEDLPPSRSGSDRKKSPPGSGFAKPARPPTDRQTAPKKVEAAESRPGEDAFKKRAVPPRDGVPPVAKIPVVTPRVGGIPRSMAEREVSDLKKFQEFALLFFGFLRMEGIEMDLLELVTKEDGNVNEDRFSLHTSPNRASTGLRYSRLMKGLMDWLNEDDRPRPKDNSAFNRLCLLEYLEWKIQEGCGAHTPKSVLLAFDFFGKAFGYDAHGGHFGRAKRLSERAARNPVQGRVGAPLFSREFLMALEDLVLDPFLPHAQRVAAGKLRLCIQSSTRYDDIANTPLSHCEWVRRPGELDIVALRSKSLKGKSGARLWIASVMGVSESGDKWLSTLVELLLGMHGQRWATDDHIGKLPTRDGKAHFDSPSRMEADVFVLKTALMNSGLVGKEAGIEVEEVMSMRWHGAKATLVTVMQHLNVPARVVRFAGSWSCPQESMADLYLREAQLLTLDAQEKALKFLRLGGNVQGLIGEGLLRFPARGGQTMDKDTMVDAMASESVPVVPAATVRAEFFDDVFEKGLPDMEKVEKEAEKVIPGDDVDSLLEELFLEEKQPPPAAGALEVEVVVRHRAVVKIRKSRMRKSRTKAW